MATTDSRTGKRAKKAPAKPVEKDEEVELSEELLEDYYSARQEWAVNAIDDDYFRNGVQWTDQQEKDLLKDDQAPIVINKIHHAVEQAKALLTSNPPRFSGFAREDSDRRVASVYSDLMAWIWDVSDGNTELKQAIDEYYVRGVGWLYAYFDKRADYGNGEVYVCSPDSFDIYVDPASRDKYVRDAAHILVSKLLTREQIQSWIPEFDFKNAETTTIDRRPVSSLISHEGQVVGNTSSFTDRDTYECIQRFTKVEKNMTRSYDQTNGKEQILTPEQLKEYMGLPAFIMIQGGQEPAIITDQARVDELFKVYKETNGIFHYSMAPNEEEPQMAPGPEQGDPTAIQGSETIMSLVPMSYIAQLGFIELEEVIVPRIKSVVSIGGVLYKTYEMPISNYPMVPIFNRWNRNPFPGSDVRLVRPLQQLINKTRSLILSHTANSANIKVFVPAGSTDQKKLKEKWARPGAQHFEYNPEFGIPVTVQPPPLPNELYQNEREASSDIDRILGVYDLMQGGPQSAPETFKGTLVLDEYGQRRIRSKRDDIEAAMNVLARTIVEMIPIYYSKRKVVRIVEPNSQPKETVLNEPVFTEHGDFSGIFNDVTVGKYDVQVISGSTLPQNRWARFEYYMQLYEKGVIDQVEVLKQTEVVDVEGVINRFSEVAKLRQQLEGAMQEIKKLSGDLQTAQREGVQDRKRVEVEKFKSDLKNVSTRAEAAGSLFEARLGDELKAVKDVVAEREEPMEPQVAVR